MAKEIENSDNELNNVNDDDKMASSGANVAESNSSEETTVDPLQSVIDKQNETIETLLKQNDALTKQFNLLLRNGAQINDGATVQQSNETEQPEHNPLFDKYPDFKDLAKDFGSWDKNKGV